MRVGLEVEVIAVVHVLPDINCSNCQCFVYLFSLKQQLQGKYVH